MERQFARFQARVPDDFAEQMIMHWMHSEGLSRSKAREYYYNANFMGLAGRISGEVAWFEPDVGYSGSSLDGELCFEEIDDDFSIPVAILEKV